MKKNFLLFLVVACIAISSSAFSAIPEGKFPIQILSSRYNPNNFEREMIAYLNHAFINSPKYRISNVDENRLMIRILIDEFIPGVISTDWLASATPIRVYTIVWLAKPKNKHAYYIWHDMGRLANYQEATEYILKSADTMVTTIKNDCPYVFQ